MYGVPPAWMMVARISKEVSDFAKSQPKKKRPRSKADVLAKKKGRGK